MNLNQERQAGAPRFPIGNYVLRITGEPEVAVSKANNVMLVFTFECVGRFGNDKSVNPEGVVDGVPVKFAGWEFPFWATFFQDQQKNLVNPGLASIHKACGLPLEFELGDDNKPIGVEYTGKELIAQCKTTEEFVTDEDGKRLLNPITGEPVKISRRNIVQIYS